MTRLFDVAQFIAFLITGGVAAIVNFSSRIVYSQWIDFSTSVILAYCTGMLTAFVLAKVSVFKESTRPLHHSAFYFVLVNLLAVAQTWLVSMWLLYYGLPAVGIQRFAAEFAHAIGVMVPVFSSYFGHKYLTFR